MQSYQQQRMNRITQDFKKNLITRYSQKEQAIDSPATYQQPRQIPNSEHKFMQLFESINKPLIQPSQSPPKTIDHAVKFTTTLEEYSSTPSFIDSVVLTNEDAMPVSYEPLALVEPPLILNQKAPFEDLIKEITNAFDGQEYRVKMQVINDHFMDLEMYSTILSSLGRKNKTAEVKSQAKGKAVIREANSIIPPARSLREFQTDTVELQQQQREESQRMKKIDLILMQLIRQKKRKNYVADYQASMEMKLMELLEFILQGEPEYMGLDPTSKTRLVLRNLESFQGKTIEGESKINLLRIFFQQFTALKKQKEEFTTPMKKLQNREKPSTKTRQPTKKTTKQESFTQQNSVSEKRSAKSRLVTAEKRDEWMGNLS